MTLFKWRDPETRRDMLLLGSWKDPAIRRALITVGLSLTFITLMALFMAGVPFTNSSYCGKMCHAVNPDYQTWSRSTHSQVSCRYCHEDSSYVGISKDRFTKPVSRMLKTRRAELKGPLNDDSAYSRNQVKNEWCQRCHASGFRAAFNKQGIKMSSTMHTKHMGAGLKCVTCHNRIAHLGAERYMSGKIRATGFKYKNYMTMRQGCWRCHSQDAKYRDPEALALVTGKVAPTECGLCHNPKSDLKPSTGPLNHNDIDGVAWKNGKERHGKMAVRDFDACLACHEREADRQAGNPIPDCSNACHQGVAMPHPATPSWTQAHPATASAKGVSVNGESKISDPNSACSMCHNRGNVSVNFCQSCHHKRFVAANNRPETPWASQHSTIVKDVGSGECQGCHAIDFCAACHMSGKKALRAGLL